ncbi:A disintegrin and metalloproteinase with thrombospondin motifs adt-2-like isoform X2 [Leptidea sinapis]|uniref:A disintegrin and metalloproteinase with thrombospondin motifs adt-2-like isoform X2 n=1 Tax=Leptidea sinapis TaxID=189913 RepID=UPI00214416A4|nr:A disintegrin and metalloproteinase with thrombospondin motifs adt-2-like isoform X2 [Leptidea sinapis]
MAAMEFQVKIVTLILILSLKAGTPARFPDVSRFHGWWPDNGGDDKSSLTDYQVVYLPKLVPREALSETGSGKDDIPFPYSFNAFGRNFDLQLVPNRRLVSPQFRVWSENGEEEPLSDVNPSCHFLHTGSDTVAALSSCNNHALHGLIMTDNSTYEVRPLSKGRAMSHGTRRGRTAHIIRRASPPPTIADDARPIRHNRRRPRVYPRPPASPPRTSYTIEIALFLDQSAYKIFYPYLNYNEAELRDLLLAYINGVQALYQHASLGTRIQLSLVRLTLLRTQPSSLPPHAERGRLLDSFCAYQKSLNVEDDDDPQHWDMALLLSGLDFYSEEGGRRNGVTMGLAPVGGVCLPAHACVVSEFGTTDTLGRPYPSAGFTSVYILAHEIGHNLGMHHDGSGNACSRDGFIMSPSRGTNGEATWSSCSARVVADLNWATCLFDGEDDLDTPKELQHNRFGGYPGAIWGAKKQCEVLLRDKDASPAEVGGGNVCAQLTCRSPHRAGFYYSGPAIPGTTCGDRKWCDGGACVSSDPSFQQSTDGPIGDVTTWSEWKSSECRSGCTQRGRGARERRRTCPATAKCEGSAYDVALCDDVKVCGKKTRVTANELAARKCTEYAAVLSDLDPRGGGLQAPHDPTRMWMGCAIFCRRSAGGGFYAPRVELNDAGLEPYFPDGTWCHFDGSTNYYCLQHHCLPENFKMTAQYHIWELPSEDVGGSFNARARAVPDDDDSAAAIRAYLSLDDRGTPYARAAIPPMMPEEPEENWEVDDFVEIPARSNSTLK